MRQILRLVRRLVLGNPAVRAVWGLFRKGEHERHYRTWTREYREASRQSGYAYRWQDSFADARKRLPRSPEGKPAGEIHTAIVALTSSWGIGLVHEAEEIGEVSVFDWEQRGFGESRADFWESLPRLQEELLAFLRERGQERPIDWLLLTTNGDFVLRDTIRRIREELGIPVVSQSLDDRHTFKKGLGPHGQDRGQLGIAPSCDLVWTSSSIATDWYAAEGAVPLFLPEGFSPRLTPRLPRKERYDVGFLGQRTPPRERLVEACRRAGLSVQARGYGWPDGSVGLEDMGEFFSQNRVNLGIGGVNYSMRLTTLKGRDFEVPGAGQTYLTTFDPDLALCFHVGTEIACYGNDFHMVDLAYELARNEEWRVDMGDRAYERSMREHRWLQRYRWILTNLGIMVDDGTSSAPVVAQVPAGRT